MTAKYIHVIALRRRKWNVNVNVNVNERKASRKSIIASFFPEGDLTQLKKSPFILKEGVSYRVKIYFYVQREIVSGLKYKQSSHRGPIPGFNSSFFFLLSFLYFLPHVFIIHLNVGSSFILLRNPHSAFRTSRNLFSLINLF